MRASRTQRVQEQTHDTRIAFTASSCMHACRNMCMRSIKKVVAHACIHAWTCGVHTSVYIEDTPMCTRACAFGHQICVQWQLHSHAQAQPTSRTHASARRRARALALATPSHHLR
eukprot:1596012-Pleurochrysis_carterae.AAC.3